MYDKTAEQDYFFRAMRASDLDLVVHNETVAYQHPWSKRVFNDCLRAGYECWVLASKDKIIGHGVLALGYEECHLLTLCLHPQFQRHGYGRRMLRHLLERGAEKEARACFLEVRQTNKEAKKLYLSMGFIQVGERTNYYPSHEGREDAIIMSCELPI